jgi:hypothetical protein
LQFGNRNDLGRIFIRNAIGQATGQEGPIEFSLRLKTPVVAIGAPAAHYYPEIGTRLKASVTIPRYAEVCNAIGAVVSSVTQTMKATITAPEEGRYRVHLSNIMREFPSLLMAADFAVDETSRLARESAIEAGAVEPEIQRNRQDTIVEGPGGRQIFVESRIEAIAIGRPSLN